MQITQTADGRYTFPIRCGALNRSAVRLALAEQDVRYTETKAWPMSLFLLRGLTAPQVTQWKRWVETFNAAGDYAEKDITWSRNLDGSYRAAFEVKGSRRARIRQGLADAGYAFEENKTGMLRTTFRLPGMTRRQFLRLAAEIDRVDNAK
jgi:hypothetical protein